MRRKQSQAGFTVIELLVSLTLLGLMLALISTALPLALSGAARTRERSDALSAIQTAQDLLRRQIGEMPVLIIQQGYSRELLFSGANDQMRFAALPLQGLGGGGPQMLALSVEHSGKGAQLRYVSGAENRYLVRGAGDIQFSYFGAPGRETGAAWHTDWKDAARLPRLVRIQVRDTDAILAFPDLVIAIQTQGPPP